RRNVSEPLEIGEATHDADALIGRSRPMQMVYKQIGRLAPMSVTVLIRGETGTGKGLVARAIYMHSARAAQAFIEVNCAAIPESTLQRELFGDELSAVGGRIGRFEQAHQGTIFLDEVGDTPQRIQASLLGVLQEQR